MLPLDAIWMRNSVQFDPMKMARDCNTFFSEEALLK